MRRARNPERDVPHPLGLHNVRFHNTGVKHFNHPAVGELHLNINRLDLAADPGLTLFTYTAEPGSRDEDALQAPRQLGGHRRPR